MKKILVIEDDRIMRENTAELLELVGYQVYVAANGKEGVEKAQAILPHLIVCDVKMPLLDGFGVLHILQKSINTASIPFIFLTAKTERQDLRKGMEMGADDYLAKPFEDTELLNAVEVRLKKRELLHQPKEPKNDLQDESFSISQAIEELKISNKDSQTYTFEAKEIIYKEGAFPHYLFYIEKGQVKTFRLNSDGKEFITNICSNQEFFGHQAIIEERSYQETAISMQPSKILKIPKEKFNALFLKNKDIASELIKKISKNLTEKEEELVKMAYDSVRKRVALKLLELIPKNKASEHSTSISRTDLASILGTTTETIVRTISEFKDLQLIEADHQQIKLIDRKKLKELLRSW